ncbi:serine/threonine protein kinase [Okeania sp. SIO2B3]|uniref:protein kinase domain-containing protein n=1 Tax=Okeania sp. SIO2B3 TaxID=2607784 RepID=UPI0013C089B7|nr:serine/threonine protein kinase [Okeania sp. SIO2B3]NET43468.1 serine/threonine protein kinase [Okeania sp. SIO2B3]
MSQLQDGQNIATEISSANCIIEKRLAEGGQGEVYQVNVNGESMALKWYFPHIVEQDPRQKERLQNAIQSGAPNDRFLWPIDLALTPEQPSSYGYIMPLREPRFKSLNDLVKRRIDPSFRALVTAGFELADSYYQLHAKGLCYRDISFGNAFFDPDTGEVRICDNDNVDVDKTPGSVAGTPRFMAPEIVKGEANPSTRTDLFSLTVLLFYILFNHHPLEGAKEQAIHCFDLPAMTKIYGTEALFIFDPDDHSNRPVPGVQDNPLVFWDIYPQSLRDLFTRAFTDGIKDPENGRVQENEWRKTMLNLRDSIIYCPHCGEQNFYDINALKKQGKLNPCWNCQKEIVTPPRIRIGKKIIMLNHDTKLFPHHVDDGKKYDFSEAVAGVVRNPKNPNLWGLKNLSTAKWVVTTADNNMKDVEPGRSVTMAVGTKINFGTEKGEIRV